MAEISAHDAARVILHIAHSSGKDVTNLKLQKLLYYCQGWYLAIMKQPLFREDIEAWVHGPVVPSVFRSYKSFRWKSLPDPGPSEIGEVNDAWPAKDCIAEVLDAYIELTGPQLESLTHSEGPWKQARAGLAQDAPSTAVITHESMREFFSSERATSNM